MKFSLLATAAFLTSLASAVPAPTTPHELPARAAIAKRATITDACDVGYASTNNGTTGGAGGTTTTVSTLAQFTAAVTDDSAAKVIVVSGTITGAQKVRVGSNKSLIGMPGTKIEGIGLFIWKQSNVIIRNLISANVLAADGDAIGIQKSSNVWVDHCEVYSDLDHDKDYYDGLIDVSHASEWITISNTHLHDHWKASLVGHSDNNAAEDTGHLHITYANNHWSNIGSRTPSLRYGTGHVYNSYFENMNTGVDSRDGAQVLVQSNVFSNVSEPIASLYSDNKGFVTAIGNDLGAGGKNTAPNGTMTATSVPYTYDLLGSGAIHAAVVGSAGATLSF